MPLMPTYSVKWISSVEKVNQRCGRYADRVSYVDGDNGLSPEIIDRHYVTASLLRG